MMDSIPAKKSSAPHTRRPFVPKHIQPMQAHPHIRPALDSPAAYDASEEDNDPLTDDAASATDIRLSNSSAASATSSSTSLRLSSRAPAASTRRPKHSALASVVSDDDGGTDSPTYDGDIESSTTAGPDHDHSNQTPALTPAPLPTATEPTPAAIAIEAFNPAKLTPEDIQDFVRRAIAREDDASRIRPYTINPSPTDRPARIYADGVYDLFHLGHALQLRQAKLAFPPRPGSSDTISGVHLLVGVNSDEQCEEHKNAPVMNHAERCEAVRHCRWVDEVVPEAPWVIDEAFMNKYQIDYVAHDEDLYPSAGQDDVYGFAKSQGKFLPTRRTPGVSTSELLERIVSRYRMRDFDKKLAKMGHAELMAEGSDWDASREESRAPSVE